MIRHYTFLWAGSIRPSPTSRAPRTQSYVSTRLSDIIFSVIIISRRRRLESVKQCRRITVHIERLHEAYLSHGLAGRVGVAGERCRQSDRDEVDERAAVPVERPRLVRQTRRLLSHQSVIHTLASDHVFLGRRGLLVRTRCL